MAEKPLYRDGWPNSKREQFYVVALDATDRECSATAYSDVLQACRVRDECNRYFTDDGIRRFAVLDESGQEIDL